MDDMLTKYTKRLAQLRLQWQFGLLLRLLLRVAGLITVLLVAYAAFDYFLALPPFSRQVINGLLMAGVLITVLVWVGGILKLTSSDMARRADQLLGSARQNARGAYELVRSLKQQGNRLPGLQRYLMLEGVEKANQMLAKVSLAANFPAREMQRQLKVAAVQACLTSVILVANWAAAQTIFSRIIFPQRDIPPYSNLAFTVTPGRPTVLYGGDVEVAVNITGGEVREQVWMLTRHAGKVHRAACFQEDTGRYAQRLEKLVKDVEFCFATGDARSRWHSVDLLLRPQIAYAEASISPPPYTGLPTRSLYVGTEEFAARRSAKVTLTIASNRPLLDGTLLIQSPDGQTTRRSIKGNPAAQKSVTFTWTVDSPARILVGIRDIQGTGNRVPLVFNQTLIKDTPPEISIATPANFVLATPRISIQLTGQADDDIGLRRIDLIRTVVGYRDRPKKLSDGNPGRRFDFQENVNLAAVGAMPGQILEFYLEAQDTNPELTGVASSELVRVQVISEEEYAALIRLRTSIDEFLQRHRVAVEELEKLRTALDQVKQDAAAKDNEKLKKSLQRAAQHSANARDFFNRLARDFPAFDSEKEMQQLVDAIAKSAGKCHTQLTKKEEQPSEVLMELMQDLIADLLPKQRQLKERLKSAKEVAELAELARCAVQFSALYRRQADIARRLDRFSAGGPKQLEGLLRTLGQQQEQIRGDLLLLQKTIIARADKLPENYAPMATSAKAFAEKIISLKIPDAMATAKQAADNGDGPLTLRNAVLARDRMAQLLSTCSGSNFGQMCQGKITFQVPADMRTTLKQLIQAMSRRGGGMGMGDGTGKGSGAGVGTGDSGYSMGGSSPLDVPVLGPQRMRFGKAGTGRGRGSGGSRGTGKVRLSAEHTEHMKTQSTDDIGSRAMELDRVPKKYLEAIKRYFTEENSE